MQRSGDSKPEPKVKPYQVALFGLITAAFLLFFGYRLGAINSNDPFGDTGRAVAVATLSLTYGYNLGLAIRHRSEEGGAEAIFYTWFFGAFATLTGISSLYDVWGLKLSLSDLVNSRPFLDGVELILGSALGTLAISSGFVETARIRFLKRGFQVFSEYLSQAVLFGYAAIKVTGDLGTGVVLSGIVVFALVIATRRKEIWKLIHSPNEVAVYDMSSSR